MCWCWWCCSVNNPSFELYLTCDTSVNDFNGDVKLILFLVLWCAFEQDRKDILGLVIKKYGLLICLGCAFKESGILFSISNLKNYFK